MIDIPNGLNYNGLTAHTRTTSNYEKEKQYEA